MQRSILRQCSYHVWVLQGHAANFLEANKFAMYVPCGAHSLNLVDRNAVDSCPEVDNFFFIVQLICMFFSTLTKRWKIQKGC